MSIPTGPQTFTIGHAEQGESFQTKHGSTLTAWKLGLIVDGMKFWPAETNRKPETPAPVVGDTIYGELSEGQYGLKFKKLQPPPPSNDVRAAEAQASVDKFEKRPAHPKDAARMGRAHAQECALRYLQLRGETTAELARVRQMIEWFVQDVDNASESHTEPSSATSTPSPTTNHVPVQTQPEDAGIPF